MEPPRSFLLYHLPDKGRHSRSPSVTHYSSLSIFAASGKPWDLVRTASHGWALLADTAFAAGSIERAEELVGLAYLSYDAACSSEWAADLHREDDEIVVTDITIDQAPAFGD